MVFDLILQNSMQLFGTKKWVQKIRKVTDLRGKDVMTFSGKDLELTAGKESRTIACESRLILGDMEALLHATRMGIGIGLLPDFICLDDVKKGLLHPILPKWVGGHSTTYLLYPYRRLLPRRTELLIAHVKDAFARLESAV